MRKISSFKIGITLVVLSIFLVVSIALAASVGIDTFDDGAQTLTASSSTPVFDFINGSMIGGQREISLTRNIPLGGAFVYVDLGDSNKLDIANNPSTLSTTVITWDGTDGNSALNPAGISPTVDLTDGENNQGLHFEVSFDDKPVNIIFRYYSGSASAYDEYVLALPGGIDSTGHVDYYIPFADFNKVGGGADIIHVGAFQMIVDASNTLSEGADVSIDFFEADNF